MGRIPVYMFDDVPWLPYSGTEADLAKFGVHSSAVSRGHMDIAVRRIQKLRSNATEALKDIDRMREWYTYEGLMRQMGYFFADPLRGGLIRCAAGMASMALESESGKDL